MRTEVPAQTVITCDCCGCRSDGVGGLFRTDSKVDAVLPAIGRAGHPVATRAVLTRYDLCDVCAGRLRQVLGRFLDSKGARS
jgi:hypothetical protein